MGWRGWTQSFLPIGQRNAACPLEVPLVVICDNPFNEYFTHANIGIIMKRLETLRTFADVADNMGFADAPRRLSICPTAASRSVLALEKSLGTG